MILVACPGCFHALRIDGEDGEMHSLVGNRSEYWPDKYPCFNCGKVGAYGSLWSEAAADTIRALTVITVTAFEAFAAFQGLGVPGERTCCAEVVEPLFARHGLKLHGRQLPRTTLYRVDYVSFPDGTRVFFGISPMGVVIYRVADRHSYAEEASDVG